MMDIEPAIAVVLDRRRRRKQSGPYHPRSEAEVEQRLNAFLASEASGARASSLQRMGGGASKEQFSFVIADNDAYAGRYVLRMEPIQSISESDRRREFEILAAFDGVVPAPVPMWLDADGDRLGQPGAIMRFVAGVTKPRGNGVTVTGLGTILGAELRALIGPQFIDHMVAIHRLDWRGADLPSFQTPDADPCQAARWQVNWWAHVWKEDRVQAVPTVTLAERWMRDNLPAAEDLVLVHGDYRTGNYLFDEPTGRVTAILDWELSHIGDFHEDLAWALQKTFGSVEDGGHLASGLYPRDEMIARYEAASGRVVNPATLRFYEVLAAYKCMVITLGTGPRSARDHHNHQDILLTWLAAVGHIFHAEICDLMERDTTQ